MTTTPPPPDKAFEAGNSVRLLRDVRAGFGQTRFKKGDVVVIEKTRDFNSTGITTPLNAKNAGYKLRGSMIVQTEKVGDTVGDGGRIPHRILRKDEQLMLCPTGPLEIGDRVYISEDHSYNLQGVKKVVKNSQVQIQSVAYSHTGNPTMNTDEAHYSFAVLSYVQETQTVYSDQYLDHSELELVTGAR